MSSCGFPCGAACGAGRAGHRPPAPPPLPQIETDEYFVRKMLLDATTFSRTVSSELLASSVSAAAIIIVLPNSQTLWF